MATPNRQWRDWILLGSMVCFLGAPPLSFALLLMVQQPVADELSASYEPHGGSGPGHFFAGGLIHFGRLAFAAALLLVGILLAGLGNIKIPQGAFRTRRWRARTWILLPISFATVLGIEMFRYL